MTTTESTHATNENPSHGTTPSSIVDTVFDLGTTWAAYGLTLGKNALIETAKALESSAKALEGLATKIAPPGAAAGEVESPHGTAGTGPTSGGNDA